MPSCSTGSQRSPVPVRPGESIRCRSHCWHRVEASLVGRLRDEAADVGVHSPGVREEEAAVRRHRVLRAHQVLEHRSRRALGVDSLRDLPELLRVAEQHDVARARPERERVGERHLARLVDEERVESASSISSRVKSHAVPASRSTSSSGTEKSLWSPRSSRTCPLYSSPFFSPRNVTPASSAARSTSSIRLWIDLWLWAVTPTRRPRLIRCTISRAPV